MKNSKLYPVAFITMFSVLLYLFSAGSLFAQTAFVPVVPGDGAITEISFNEGQIKGSVSLGDSSASPCHDCDSIGCVSMVKAKVWASGTSPYSDKNDLSAGPVWTDSGSNFQYTLPVQIPCERDGNGICTGTVIDAQNYNVSCRVYYSNSGDSYLDFKTKSADARYWQVSPLHFTMNPGYIKGKIAIAGETLSGGYIYASSSAAANYINTRIRIGSDGEFCFPVQAPAEDITLYAQVTTAGGVNLRLENQTIEYVGPGQVTEMDLSMDPGYIEGSISVLNGLTLSGGRIYAYLKNSVNANAPIAISGSEGAFSFPVQAPYDNIQVTPQNIITTTGNHYNLESKYANVVPGVPAVLNWEFEPTSSISGNFVLNGLGANSVDRHWMKAVGNSGWKETTISSNGIYSLTYLLPGTYNLDVNTSLNNGDDYFHPPYENYVTPISVADHSTAKDDIKCNAAFIEGNITFRQDEGLSVVNIQNADWANIYGDGSGNSVGGMSRDKVDVNNGRYDLIVSEGEWRVYRTEFKFDESEVSLCSGCEPVYLNSYLYITDHARKVSDYKKIVMGPGQLHNEEIKFMTGGVTFIYLVREGDALESPWLKGGSIERDKGYVADISDDIKKTKTVGIWNENRDPKAGEATMVGTPGWYSITAGGVFNGIDVSFGAQGEFARKKARKSNRKDSEDLGIEVLAGEHKIIYVDIYPPSLNLENPLAMCRGLLNESITVSGTASDDVSGIAEITVNGEQVDFIPTDNPDDPNEVFFSAQADMDIDTNSIRIVVTDALGKTASDTKYVYTAGLFTVGASGVVTTDYLYDGGMYEGELGIFSLSGMEKLVPNSGLFIEEAVRRALSNSASGYVVLSDQREKARLSGQLGSGGEHQDWNRGIYEGVKSFRMKPGDRFATVLIPDDTLQSFYESPDMDDPERRPLFSLASANPEFEMFFGQIANVDDFGNAFVYEDRPAIRSDWDYNDLIVRITGITACAPTLDNTDISLAYDWRDMELGGALTEHIQVSPPDADTLWMTVILKSPADLIVYDPQGRFIGKEGGYIPGATFETDENGHQIIRLPALEAGDYRIVLRAKGDGGLCHLEVTGYQGETSLVSNEKPFVIEPHQVLTTSVSADAFLENLTIDFSTPEIPKSSNGTPLVYDFDADGIMSDGDIEKVSAMWNLCEGDPDFDSFFDFDEDGCITVLDIMPVANSKDVH